MNQLSRASASRPSETGFPAACTSSPRPTPCNEPREGWQFIAVGSELKMMLDGAADAARQINKDDAPSELAKY